MGLQSIAPESILGGGALRDLDNGRPIKDLDFFVPFDADLDAIRAYLASLDPDIWCARDICASYMDDEMFEVERIVEFRVDGREVNVIAVKEGTTPTEDTKRYDFGLCQIWFDGETVHTTDAYRADKAAKTLTLVRAENEHGIERSMRRFERLSKKYNWPLVRSDLVLA